MSYSFTFTYFHDIILMKGGLMTTAFRIKTAMDKAGLTQIEFVRRAQPLCEKYNTRFGTNDINQYLKGKYCPKGSKLNIICEVLNVSPSYGLGYDDEFSDEEIELIEHWKMATDYERNSIRSILRL